MSDLDRMLEGHLRSSADELYLPGAGPAAVAARGRRRQARRRAGAGVALAMVAVGGTVAVLNRPGPDRTVATPADAVAEGGATGNGATAGGAGGAPAGVFSTSGVVDPVVVESTSSWRRVVPGTTIGWAMVSGGDGGFVALSTSPGRSDMPTSAVYASSDGIEWQQTAMPDDLKVQTVTRSGGRFLAVGTAPGTALVGDTAVPDVVVGTSDDGAGWSTATLPVDLVAAKRLVPTATAFGQAVQSPAGTVVAVSVNGYLDAAALSDGRVPVDRAALYTPEGIQVDAVVCEDGDGSAVATTRAPSGDPYACTPAEAEFYSWEELGVPEAARDIVLGRTTLYVSDGAGGFRELASPTPLVGVGTALFATADGVALMVTPPYGGSATMFRWNGGAWSGPATVPAGYVTASGVLGGRVALVMQRTDGAQQPFVALQADDGGWIEVPLGSLVPEGSWPAAAAISDDGIVLGVGAGYEAGEQLLLESADGLTWSRTDLSAAVGEPTAEVIHVTAGNGTFTVRAALGTRSGGPDATRDPVVLVRSAG